MKAAIIEAYGTAVKIADVPKPALADDSVMVEVHAASLNPIDNLVRAGYLKDMMPIHFPYVMGYDLSGVVSEVGKNVNAFAVGDAVYARPNQEDSGSLAEFARVKAGELALKPTSISHSQAASIPLAGLTAWQAMFDKAELKSGQKILIHSGSGGVGTLAIQIAKQAGAFVATTVSTRNIELAKNLGADLVIDYKTENFEDIIADYDVVFDMLGGDTLAKSFKVLKKGGCLVSIKGQDPEDNAGKFGVRFEWFFMQPNGAQLGKIATLIDQGSIKPVIDSTFSMSEVSKAYEHLATGHAVGKIVVKVK